MKSMDLRDVPDEVYEKLERAAEERGQSLNAFVVDLLETAAKLAQVEGYFRAFSPPEGTGITSEDAVEAVRKLRDAS